MARAPWLAGASLLALAAALVLLLALRFGLRAWPYYVGLVAMLVLLAGWLERRLQARPLFARPRGRGSARLRVLPGRKGNGGTTDPEGTEEDRPRWVM
jgi:hypothetical protein